MIVAGRLGNVVVVVPAATKDEPLRDGILAATAQGLAAREAPQRQRTATHRTEARDCNPCIIGATGVEATALPQQGAEPAFVEAEQKKQESGQDSSRGRDGWRFVVHPVFQKRACWCKAHGL